MEKIVGLPPVVPQEPSCELSNVKKRKKRSVNESTSGEKEQRKANYMKKIFNDNKATKASSFQKRKPTLKKKAQELQTLCGVDVCMVFYDSKGNVDIWPEERTKVEGMIFDYEKLRDKEKRECTILGILEDKKRKLEAKLQEAIKRKVGDVIKPLSKLVDGLHVDALVDVVEKLDSNLKYLKERIGLVLEVEGEKEQFKEYNDLGFLPINAILDNNEMVDIGAILGPCNNPNTSYMGYVTNYGNVVDDSMTLESFETPTEGYNINSLFSIEGYNTNSLFNIENVTPLGCHYDGNPVGFGQVGTSHAVNCPSSNWSNVNDIGSTSYCTVGFDQVHASQENNVLSNYGSMSIGNFEHQVLNVIP